MKTSTKFALLAFGAASLAAVMIAPASSQVVGGSNCSNLRGMVKKQSLTRATDDMLKKKAT